MPRRTPNSPSSNNNNNSIDNNTNSYDDYDDDDDDERKERIKTSECIRRVANISQVKPAMLIDSPTFNETTMEYASLHLEKAAPVKPFLE